MRETNDDTPFSGQKVWQEEPELRFTPDFGLASAQSPEPVESPKTPEFGISEFEEQRRREVIPSCLCLHSTYIYTYTCVCGECMNRVASAPDLSFFLAPSVNPAGGCVDVSSCLLILACPALRPFLLTYLLVIERARLVAQLFSIS
jgi:hypothetical protein